MKSVGMKISLGFAVALVILLIVGAVTYASTGRLTQTADRVARTHKGLEDLDHLLQALTDAETGQRGFVITANDAYLEPYTSGAAEVDKCMKALREELGRDNVQSPEQLQRLADLQKLSQERLTSLKEILDLQRAKGQDAARERIMTGAGKAEMDRIRAIVGSIRDYENGQLKLRSEEVAASALAAKLTIIFGTIIALIVLSAVALGITRNISGPLKEITRIAGQIAAGDLSTSVSLNHRQDEVGALAHSFARMTESLRATADAAIRIAGGDLQAKIKPQSESDVLGNAFCVMVENLQKLIARAVDGIHVLSAAANKISTSTTQLASSAAQTATAVSEATTTVEEVRQTAQLSSQKSRLVSESAQKMAQISQSGLKSTEDNIAGIHRIRQQMTSIAESMVRLSEQSQTIGQIVATVEDLAAQSNILAVNASIEAAKAGDHGKGFAVVAQEMRSLSEQSKQATNQVRTVLTDIQKATSAAALATEQGSKAVEAGVSQASDASHSIQELSGSVSEAAQTATQIAASSQQQLVGVDQVAAAMENIKQASMQNVTSAKQLEAAALDLKELSQRLRQTVEGYKV